MNKIWFVHFPKNAYAYEFPGDTVHEAKQAARDWLNTKRLPTGTTVWEKNIGHDEALVNSAEQQELFRYR